MSTCILVGIGPGGKRFPMGVAQYGCRDVTVRISMVAAESDDERLERQTQLLRSELAEMDGVESATLARDSTETPPGAKIVDPISIGAIVLAMSASGGVFTTVIGAVREWLDRHAGTHRIAVTIDGESIEIDSASNDQQRALVDAFIGRHSGVATG